jgi:MraZ protein
VAKNGIKWCKVGFFVLFLLHYTIHIMISFIGDYSCKVDSKGRITLPSAFKRQMKEGAQDGFVLKSDVFEKCLILYPMKEWERQNQIIRARTNPYNKEHAKFLRMFFSGTAELILDASGRVLLPKRLLDYAGIAGEAVMAGQYGRIEIWAASSYEKVSRATDEFASMAEKILGGSNELTDGQ